MFSVENILNRSYPRFASITTTTTAIERVKSMKILGVILNHKLRASDHVGTIINNCSRSLYALRILKVHGLQSQAIHKVTEAIVIINVTFALRVPSLVGTNNNER